jgi:hypothetical protein
MEQNHDSEGCGNCAACQFEQELKNWETKTKLRVLDATHETAPDIEKALNKLDAEGYEMVAVDHGMVYLRAIPPRLPPELARGMQIIKASDLMKDDGPDGFSDEDIGEPIK